MIKTFRGLLADGGQDQIRLSTIKGKVGYRIVKFQIFPELPGTTDIESTVQIFKEKQSSVSTTTATVNFSSSDLLGVAFMTLSLTVGYDMQYHVVFDREIFNQDIYVTHTDTISSSSKPINYYMELEVIPLDDAGAEYTTLKDMRST